MRPTPQPTSSTRSSGRRAASSTNRRRNSSPVARKSLSPTACSPAGGISGPSPRRRGATSSYARRRRVLNAVAGWLESMARAPRQRRARDGPGGGRTRLSDARARAARLCPRPPRQRREHATAREPAAGVRLGLLVGDEQPLLSALPEGAARRPVLVLVGSALAIDDERAQAEPPHLASEAPAAALEAVGVHLRRDRLRDQGGQQLRVCHERIRAHVHGGKALEAAHLLPGGAQHLPSRRERREHVCGSRRARRGLLEIAFERAELLEEGPARRQRAAIG